VPTLVKAPELKLVDEMPEPLGAIMWTPSRGSVARCTGHWRIADYLADDQTTNTDTSNKESFKFTTAYVYVVRIRPRINHMKLDEHTQRLLFFPLFSHNLRCYKSRRSTLPYIHARQTPRPDYDHGLHIANRP
jgi:hypothetical protein